MAGPFSLATPLVQARSDRSSSDEPLPPRAAPYGADQVLEAVASRYPAFELPELPDSRSAEFTRAGAARLIADDACCGRFALGPAARCTTRAKNELSALGVGLRAADGASCGTCMVPLQILPGDRIAADCGHFGCIGIGVAA